MATTTTGIKGITDTSPAPDTHTLTFRDLTIAVIERNWDPTTGSTRLDTPQATAQIDLLIDVAMTLPLRPPITSPITFTHNCIQTLFATLHICADGVDNCPIYETDCCGAHCYACEMDGPTRPEVYGEAITVCKQGHGCQGAAT